MHLPFQLPIPRMIGSQNSLGHMCTWGRERLSAPPCGGALYGDVPPGFCPTALPWAGKCCRLQGGSKFACVDSRKKVKAAQVLPVRPLLALAAIFSRGTCRPTTIDVLMFHFRVRNGTGWGHQAVTTRLRRFSFAAPCARVSSQGWFVESSVQFPGWGGLASARRWDLRFTMYYVLF